MLVMRIDPTITARVNNLSTIFKLDQQRITAVMMDACNLQTNVLING